MLCLAPYFFNSCSSATKDCTVRMFARDSAALPLNFTLAPSWAEVAPFIMEASIPKMLKPGTIVMTTRPQTSGDTRINSTTLPKIPAKISTVSMVSVRMKDLTFSTSAVTCVTSSLGNWASKKIASCRSKDSNTASCNLSERMSSPESKSTSCKRPKTMEHIWTQTIRSKADRSASGSPRAFMTAPKFAAFINDVPTFNKETNAAANNNEHCQPRTPKTRRTRPGVLNFEMPGSTAEGRRSSISLQRPPAEETCSSLSLQAPPHVPRSLSGPPPLVEATPVAGTATSRARARSPAFVPGLALHGVGTALIASGTNVGEAVVLP
mmetsp:Transcript_62550/g.204153  ORF Transcript_62550/g.204153 Transcript_62550/m.204153 type:complete len:323 (-) Transcript_62550:193-1161(-)